MADKPYYIKYESSRRSENKYKLEITCYDFLDDGSIKYIHKFIDYFKSETKARAYYNKHIKEYKTKLIFSDVYNSIIKYKNMAKGYYKNFKYSYDKVKCIHEANVFDITLKQLTNIILSFETYSIRKKVRLLFSQIYKFLISQGIEIKDISKDIEIPRISNKNIQYCNPFTPDEINIMCNDYYDDFVFDIIMFMIHTGIKIYTLFKLQIKDIDIKNSQIRIYDEMITKVISLDDITKDIVKKNYSNNKEYLFELNDKQIEYTVFKRYHYIPFINHYGFNHNPQDAHSTFLKYKGDKDIMARRREKGSGGIKYRKGRTLPYEAQVTVFKDGEPKRVVIGKYATEEEAKIALDKYNNETSDNDKNKYLYTFEEVYKKMVEYRTVTKAAKDPNHYSFAFKAVEPLHKMRFSSITHNDLFKTMIESKKNYPTIKKIKLLFKLMYNYAIAERIVVHDETLALKISENSELFPYEKRIVHKAFKEDEVKELLSDELNPEMVKIFKFLIYTGLRINEFFTLTKDVVDLENKTITIKPEFSKTASSARIVPIHPAIYDIVLEKYNNAKYSSSPLFTTMTGNVFHDKNFREAYWIPFMELHNMEHLPHDTRYTFSTFWEYLKLQERDGEMILGHSRKTDMSKLYKTPELKHLHTELAKLRFELVNEPKEDVVVVSEADNELDEFKRMKAEMQKLGFTSMQEYMEYLEFKKLKQRL